LKADLTSEKLEKSIFILDKNIHKIISEYERKKLNFTFPIPIMPGIGATIAPTKRNDNQKILNPESSKLSLSEFLLLIF
jgi:hypothetical protein